MRERFISVEAYKARVSANRYFYFRGFTKYYLKLFESHIKALIKQKQDWDRDGNGIGLPGESVDEILYHYMWARKKCESFYGREDLIKQCLSFINTEGDRTSKITEGAIKGGA